MIRSRLRLPARPLLVLGLVAVLAGCSGSGAPTLADPSGTGMELATKYFELLKAKDVAGLDAFLDPAFQLQRADGSGDAKADYLAKGLPSIDTYSLTGVAASQEGATLVVRYLATVAGTANGKAYTNKPAPRLSVFVWSSGAWKLVAHSNFNPLQ